MHSPVLAFYQHHIAILAISLVSELLGNDAFSQVSVIIIYNDYGTIHAVRIVIP